MIEVSEQKFDKIIEKGIKLDRCKKCGNPTGMITVEMPWYGRTGAQVKCLHCGHKTKLYGISYVMVDSKRIGTPVIDKSLMLGIKRAIADWNGKI